MVGLAFKENFIQQLEVIFEDYEMYLKTKIIIQFRKDV